MTHIRLQTFGIEAPIDLLNKLRRELERLETAIISNDSIPRVDQEDHLTNFAITLIALRDWYLEDLCNKQDCCKAKMTPGLCCDNAKRRKILKDDFGFDCSEAHVKTRFKEHYDEWKWLSTIGNTSKHGTDDPKYNIQCVFDKDKNYNYVSSNPFDKIEFGWTAMIEIDNQELKDAVTVCSRALSFWDQIYNETVRAFNRKIAGHHNSVT